MAKFVQAFDAVKNCGVDGVFQPARLPCVRSGKLNARSLTFHQARAAQRVGLSGGHPMAYTRRTLMTGLATAPLAAAATVAAITSSPAAPDPIFDVIEWYRRAVAAVEAADAAHYAAASNEHIAAWTALFNTVPSTHAGCLALIQHVLVDATDEVGSDSHTTLLVLAAALQKLA
jgi:hypothetical protein